MLPGPFLGWLGMLMFLLVMQFLIKYLPDIVGKGLPLGLIIELIAYNLAYMVVLAVPMSVLIAALVTFGRLAETNSYMVIKSAGISLGQLIWPALLVGGAIMGGMWYFNSDVLPEANFRARNLFLDIQRKRPDFEIQPGIFYNGLSGYSILVQRTNPETSILEDILIYDHRGGTERSSIVKAQRGWIEPVESTSFMDLILEDGEAHRHFPQYGPNSADRYERLAFTRFRLRVDVSDLNFRRSNPTDSDRSDRTMRASAIMEQVDSLQAGVARERTWLHNQAMALISPKSAKTDSPSPLPVPVSLTDDTRTTGVLAGLDPAMEAGVYSEAAEGARIMQQSIEDLDTSTSWDLQRIDRYKVEIHKKRSLAIACLIFMLIGVPLGLSVGRGGLGISGALAIGIFLFYWVSLVQGEKLADRGLLQPWISMWLANAVMIAGGLWLILYVWMDLRATPPLRKRLLGFMTAGKSD
jgi:lipopolysaccharide export system permease protein